MGHHVQTSVQHSNEFPPMSSGYMAGSGTISPVGFAANCLLAASALQTDTAQNTSMFPPMVANT